MCHVIVVVNEKLDLKEKERKQFQEETRAQIRSKIRFATIFFVYLFTKTGPKNYARYIKKHPKAVVW